MIFQIQDWIFDVDVESTSIYNSSILEEHCECGYCRNYYQAIDGAYPELKPFLRQFGADAEAPVDFLPVEPTLCVVSFAVSGRIVVKGNPVIQLGALFLSVQEASELDYQLTCPQPYFVFTTEYLDLPWLLEEDMNEVVSPANEPECLDRMWRKLLANADNSFVHS